jgi:Flp pilus assembly protein TadG
MRQVGVARRIRHGGLFNSRGTAAVEFALVAPILILMLVGILDFGTAYWEKTAVDDAAWAGAVYAAVNGYSGNSSGISGAMTSASGLTSITASVGSAFYGCPTSTGITTASSSSTSCSSGGSARTYLPVTASAQYKLLLSYPGFPSTLTLTSTATARIK